MTATADKLLTADEVAARLGVSAKTRFGNIVGSGMGDNPEMARRRGQRKGYLRIENGSWLLTYRIYDRFGRASRPTVRIGLAEGRGKLTQKQAERVAWDHYLSKEDQVVTRAKHNMTASQFWRERFEPTMQARLKRGTREQYKSLWATYVEPLIGHLEMARVNPDHVEGIIAQVLNAGKSAATARHVRKVISAVFHRARRLQFVVDNPVTLTDAPAPAPKRVTFALSPEQCGLALAALPSPYWQMAFTALLTSMNAAEFSGLKWRHLNLTDSPVLDPSGESIKPRTIAVREHWARSERTTLKTKARRREIPIPEALRAALLQIQASSKYTGPDDPVFASRTGKPISANNVQKRWLVPLGEKLNLPGSLGWHTFRHTQATLTKFIGLEDRDRAALTGHASSEILNQVYTHIDAKTAAVSEIAQLIGQHFDMLLASRSPETTKTKVVTMRKVG